MTQEPPNKSIEPTGASRSVHFHPRSPRRLAPAAHADRYVGTSRWIFVQKDATGNYIFKRASRGLKAADPVKAQLVELLFCWLTLEEAAEALGISTLFRRRPVFHTCNAFALLITTN